MDAPEFAARAGVEVATIYKWKERHSDTFPEPLMQTSTTPLWWWPEVERFLLLRRSK